MLEAYKNRALLVDLYELTMAAGFFEHRIECRATFELFVRQLPPERGYLIAAGLDSALGYLENLRFTDEDVRFLREQPAFHTVSDQFFDYLRDFQFSGDVNAIPEGALVFAGEPLLHLEEGYGRGSGSAFAELKACTPASLSPSNGVAPLPGRQNSSSAGSANHMPIRLRSTRR